MPCTICLWDDTMTKLDKEIQEGLYDPASSTSLPKLYSIPGKRPNTYLDERNIERPLPPIHILRFQELLEQGSLQKIKEGIHGKLRKEVSDVAIRAELMTSAKLNVPINKIIPHIIDELIDRYGKLYDPKKSANRGKTYIAWNIKEQKPVGWLGTAKNWVEMEDILKKYKAPNHITSKRLFDPKTSALPPTRWYEAMVKGIKRSSDVRNPYAIVKGIWSKLSSSGKAKIRTREKKGEHFKYDLPLPVDKPTRGTGTVRMVKPFKLAEVQVNMSVKDYLTARASGLFQKMKREDGTTALVARCKSPEKNVNIFVDKAGGK